MPLPRIAILTCLALSVALSGAAAPLRVGIDTHGEPMTFVDSHGRPSGFVVELLNAIAQDAHLDIAYVPRPLPELFAAFQAGQIDVIANIVATPERATTMDFAVYHVQLPRAIYVRKEETRIKTPADLAHRRVGGTPGGPADEYLRAHNLPHELVECGPMLRDNLSALHEGRVDAVIGPRPLARKIVREENLFRIAASDIELTDFPHRLHLGVRRGDKRTLARINESLAVIRANGTYDELYEKWIGPLEPRPLRLEDVHDYLVPAILVMSAILGVLILQRRAVKRLAQQKEQLRQSEERLKLVLEGSEDGFWDWDLRTNRIERSERWAAMLGYELREIGATPEAGRAFVHPDDLEKYDGFRTRLDRGDRTRYDVEYRMRSKSGEWRWILDRGKVVARGADGTPLRMAGTHTDITDLKRAREEALRLETRFQFIYEHAPVGLSWMQRRQDNTRLVNRAHERITGVPAANSQDSANYAAATHPDDWQRQQAFVERLYRGEIDHFSMEKRYVRPNGQIVWAMLNMHIFRDPVTGDIQEVGTLIDITELKRAEAEREKIRLKMLETQKLESLGVLAGGIAHDFNNLLTVILANATFVRSEGNSDERIVHIESAARRAADLCRQLLAYAGKGRFVVEPVDLGALVRDTTHLLQVSISKKACLNFSLTPNLPPVEADASQLRQVVMNLVINASDALGDSTGDIRIATRVARPQAPLSGVIHSFDLPAGDCVCLEISDTGTGMNAATLARIFDPFFTTKFAGRGLGLAAVLGIVRAHHGALTVESTPGEGSTFRLYLPATARTTDAAKVQDMPAAVAANGHGTILVADDEPIVLATADKVLRYHGYRTVLAANGHEALQRFRENPRQFATVLLDLTMPGLDGAEVLRAIRSDHPYARVLVMSGFSEVDVFNRLRGLGEVSILHKPFTQETLIARVAELVDR